MIAVILAALLVPAALLAMSPTPPTLTHAPFGRLPDGRTAEIYTLTNGRGMKVEITNFGGIVVRLDALDRKGVPGDVVLGYDTLAGYLGDTQTYFGALIGRYANRIAFGRFSLDGHVYTLAINNGKNSLHGGREGFNRRLWAARDVSTSRAPALQLTYISANGEEGYPGKLTVQVVYTLSENNELAISYTATTDRDTVLNLTNHSYFNLNGAGHGDILATRLRIFAHQFTPINSDLIPTGPIAKVGGTPLDFTRSTPIGAHISEPDSQLAYARGYDFNYVLDTGGRGQLAEAADAFDPASGRELKVFTTQPGIQLYTGNFLDGTIRGKGGLVYERHGAFCLETQHYPDSPNHPNFPSTELKPGETFRHETVYSFSAH
ncbi:MAG: aldose epimerase family protein [Terriglobales bacterium]